MFNLKQYKFLLAKFKQEGLIPSVDWTNDSDINKLLIRHDIDFSVEFAHKLASFEFNLGINSTYFFMLTSNMYNFLSTEHKRMVKEISEMGHKISIHFDPTAYNELSSFQYEKDLFESIFKIEVDIASIHRPGSFLDNNNILLCGVAHTYNDIFFKQMNYISDSGGRDIRPQIAEYLEKPRTKGLHLLVHPIWWVGEGNNPTNTLNNWRQENLKFITSEIRLNCKTYKS